MAEPLNKSGRVELSIADTRRRSSHVAPPTTHSYSCWKMLVLSALPTPPRALDTPCPTP